MLIALEALNLVFLFVPIIDAYSNLTISKIDDEALK